MTNGDKIRTYTNKELASLFATIELDARINGTRIIPTEYAISSEIDILRKVYEEILESEVSE